MNNRHDLSENTWLKSQPREAHSGQLSAPFWTWPLWVICAPVFDHEIGNGANCGSSGALFFTKPHNWTKQRRKKWTTERLRREKRCFWRSPTMHQPTERLTAEIITPRCGLTMFWLFSVISCSNSYAEKFVICLQNKAYHIFENTDSVPYPDGLRPLQTRTQLFGLLLA